MNREITNKLSMTQNEIRQVVADQFRLFEEEYHRHTYSGVQLMQEVNDYVDRRSGKRLRPLLLLLADGGRDIVRASRLAAAMEMLHSASLMHDDVVDESTERRGQESVNGHWGNAVAVLCGDYYLSRVMNIMNELDEKEATRIVNNVVKEMCEGELIQQQYLRGGVFDKGSYMDVIYKKTAVLMRSCCELGNPLLREFGEHFGMAFQLRDDLMDYGTEETKTLPPLKELQAAFEQRIEAAVDSLSKLPETPYTKALKHLALNLLQLSA